MSSHQKSPPSQSQKDPLSHVSPSSPQLLSPAQRRTRQIGLYLLGTSSIILSTILTRRAITRHHRLALASLKPFQRSNEPVDPLARAQAFPIAAEALQLATLNVLSWGMMFAGGVSWALDLSSFGELSRYVRRHIGPLQGSDTTGRAAEDEFMQVIGKYLNNERLEDLMKKALEEERVKGGTNGVKQSGDEEQSKHTGTG